MSLWDDIEDCSTCNGTDYITCPEYHGFGEDPYDSGIRCDECDGEKVIDCSEDHEHCMG